MNYRTGALAAFGLVGGMALTAALPANAAVTPATPQHPTSTMPERVSSIQPQHSVALMQEALNSTGARLRVDGIWGSITEAALRNYQKQHGLDVTGHLNTATRQMLDPIG